MKWQASNHGMQAESALFNSTDKSAASHNSMGCKMSRNKLAMACGLFVLLSAVATHADKQATAKPTTATNLSRDQLVAWCIVPFDGKKRGPAERAAMLKRIGMKRVAYDWRSEHVATFEQEILEYKKHGLEYFAFWSVHEEAFKLFEKHKITPQIWAMLAAPRGETQQERVANAAKQILPLVERTRKLGSKLGLYNHGGWQGEPENMVAVCNYLREHHKADHVGVVYNQHHAHGRIDDFAALIKLVKPYLLCLNLNGMTRNGDKIGRKILPLGEGEFDVPLLRIIRDSGYAGPIGIIGHTQDDVEQRLLDNLDGLDWIRPQLNGKPAGPKPKLRTWSNATAPKPPVKVSGVLLEGQPGFRTLPITVECQATLPSKASYNILVASDTKASGAHWEIFSMNGSGMFTAYLPGMQPDHVNSKAMIVDGKPHTLGMTLEAERVRLFVDGKPVADQAVKSTGKAPVPGGLGIGRLVSGALGSSGSVDWVRISRGVRDLAADNDIIKDKDTLVLWRRSFNRSAQRAARPGPAEARGPLDTAVKRAAPEYSLELVDRLVADCTKHGDAHRGLLVFSSAKSACLSCHKLGKHGGTIGPDLITLITKRKPAELIESVIWPKRKVEPKYTAHLILTEKGLSHRGYIVSKDAKQLVLRDPAKGLADGSIDKTIKLADIDFQREVGTLMPDNLLASMSEQQTLDLFRFLTTLGRDEGVKPMDMDSILTHAHSHMRGPAKFDYDRKPLHPEHWPSWQHHVNRNRVYDFYAKQADHFRTMDHAPALLEEFPGLDGGKLGHWGNQNEETWASDAWNKTKLGRVQCGTFRGAGVTVPRGICVRLGENNEMSVCFNADTLTYDAIWTGGFLKFSSVRHGFLSGLIMNGKPLSRPKDLPSRKADEFIGMVQAPDHVWFVFRQVLNEKEFIVSESPRIRNGQFEVERHQELAAVRGDHPPLEWYAINESKSGVSLTKRTGVSPIETSISHGTESPYAIDTIQLPTDNPRQSLMFAGGLAFENNGSALVCTMQGEVWRVQGFMYPSKRATWQRFAEGLFQPLGMHVDDEGIFVIGRDRITKLRDADGDGFAEVHETVNDAYQTSTGGHDFICGLVRDKSGCFYTVSGNQGVLELCGKATVRATGFRNADGIGLLPDGTITVPCSEGSWTPASMICAVRPGMKQADGRAPFFGYRGPAANNGNPPELPLVYLPRGVDNSAGGQCYVDSDRWGPLKGQLIHTSFGTGSHMLILQDEVDGQLQGAVVPLPGEFRSGVHRAKINPKDGQLYVSGMQGWGSYTPETGCFQRVRYTGDPVQVPVGFHVHQNGVTIKFSRPIDADVAANAKNHFAQCWNYRYSAAYGSPEFSTKHYGMRGHDVVRIRSAHVLDDGHTLFLELPDLQPVNQLHLRLKSGEDAGETHSLFVTVHKLDKPFTIFPGYKRTRKHINPHPILADLAIATRRVPNPHAKKIKNARKITIETGTNLSFATRTITTKPGEAVELTLSNPDTVPHNWALLKPGTLERVGGLANRLISDPEAAVRQYIPNTTDVLAYTDVVLAHGKFTIWFRAPSQPGRYPFLCTFPGHWLVMNGELVVD